MTVNVITFAYTFEFAQANTTLQIQFPLHFPRLVQHLPNEERCQI